MNAALGREPGCSAEEVLAMGNAYRFPGPQKDGEGRIRRINADGRISMPSVLARRDGPTQKVMRYVVHASDGAEPRTMTVMRSGPWITGVICFILWSPSWSKMDHIVYLDKSAGALEAMRHGKKTMVGRAYNGRRSPYGKVKTGDMLYFTENDGKQIIYGRGRVTVVYDSPKLTHDESVGLLERFRRPLWLSEAQFLRMTGKRYLVLVTVDGFQEVPRFRFTRRDFHTMDDWILVGDVEKARDDDPVRDMK